MTKNEILVIEAEGQPRIKDLKAVQLDQPIKAAITNAYFIKGFKDPGAQVILEIHIYVVKTLKESFTTYRVTEICQAIEIGARGELFSENDLNIISPENIFKWIYRYNEKIRKEAISKQRQYEDKIAKETTEEERREKIKEFEHDILNLFQVFPEGFKKQNKGVLASYYRHLDSLGLVKMYSEDKKKIFNGILKIKDRTRWMKKPLIELTAKELSEYRALHRIFTEMKYFDYHLELKINL